MHLTRFRASPARFFRVIAPLLTAQSVVTFSSLSRPAVGAAVVLDKAQLKAKLTPLQYHVTQEKGTERSWSSPYNEWPEGQRGSYTCVCCGSPLFSAESQFHSGSGWPSFYSTIAEDAVSTEVDLSHGMTRHEISCGKCGAHLGVVQCLKTCAFH